MPIFVLSESVSLAHALSPPLPLLFLLLLLPSLSLSIDISKANQKTKVSFHRVTRLTSGYTSGKERDKRVTLFDITSYVKSYIFTEHTW